MADLAGASVHMVGRRVDTLGREARRMMGVGAMKAIVGWNWDVLVGMEKFGFERRDCENDGGGDRRGEGSLSNKCGTMISV